MKNLITLILILFTISGFSQTLPSTELKTLDGKTIKTDSLNNNGKPMVISFWATWCKPCVKELTAIAEVYDEWKEETGVKIIAISIDDVRNISKIAPYVNGKAWEYEIYLDSNKDFKRLMSVENVPHTFLLNGKGEIVWQHSSYSDGDEEELYNQIKKLIE